MKAVKVMNWLLLGFALMVPASWGAESGGERENTAEPAVSAGWAAGKAAELPEIELDPAGSEVADKSEPVTQSDLQGVRNELETLRDQWQRTYDKRTANTTRSLKFSGSGQVRYTGPEDDALKNGFSISSFILRFQGNLKKDFEEGRNVDYTFAISNNSSTFNIQPQDAFLTYSVLPTLDLEGPYLNVAVGQLKKPFGWEAQASEEYKPTIRSAQVNGGTKFSGLTNTGGLGLDERDLGVVIRGDLFPHVDYGYRYRVPVVDYAFGVINGNGPNTGDDNDQKDILGRIAFNAPVDFNDALRGLTFGVSGYLGKKQATATRATTTRVNVPTVTPPPASIAVTTASTSTTLSRLGDKKRWGADLSYVNTPIGFTLEYVRGEDAAISNETTTTTNGATTTIPSTSRTVRSEGYTVTVFYNFGEQFQKQYKQQERYDDWYPLTYQPFVRFDRFDPDLGQPDNRIDIYTIGFNAFFAETTKLQLNYNIKGGQIPTAQKNNEFLAQFQFGF